MTTSNNSQRDNKVDVRNQMLMIELGMHPCFLAPKDPSVWTKSDYEKKMLRSLRRMYKGEMHFHSIPIKSIPVQAKLIVQLKKNKQFPKTTYSFTCWMHQIGNILSSFHQTDKRTGTVTNVVAKYTYNGKTYSPNERPFWR